SVSLSGRSLVRGGFRPAPGRPGPARLPRLARATASAAHGRTETDGQGADDPRGNSEGAAFMNELGITLIELGVQVTVLAMLGLPATLLAARWSAGAGARMALGPLVGSVMLLLLTCCPLPSWWTCTGPETTPEVSRTANPPQVGKALPLERSVLNHS